MIKASEACTKFNVIFSGSKKLLSKVKVSLKFPDVQIENVDGTVQIESRLNSCPGPLRGYQHLEIIRLRDDIFDRTSAVKSGFFNVISKLSPTVNVLIVKHCQILRKNLIKLMRPFQQLTECHFLHLMLQDNVARADIMAHISCPNMRKLVFSNCDFFCLIFFKSIDKLESLSILEPLFIRGDVVELENFLMKQEHLKELNLLNFRFNSSYSTDRLANVPFQLEALSLDNVYWDILHHCEVFLKSQRNLKKLELKSFHRMIAGDQNNYRWFCSVMQSIFTGNSRLYSFATDTKSTSHRVIKDDDFLIDIVNNNLTELTYNKGRDDESELLKSFTRIFPKTKILTFRDGSLDSSALLSLIQLFKNLDSLELRVAAKSLTDFQIGSEKLKTFKYCATNEEKSAEKLTKIFASNPSINKIALNIEPLTVDEITEVLLPLSQNLESLSISDLHLNNEEAEMITVNFPRLRKIRSDFPLNSSIKTILSNAGVKFDFVGEEFLFQQACG